MLKVNKDKTELIVFLSKQHVKKTKNLRIKVGSSYINSSIFLRNLELILETLDKISHYGNTILSSCYMITSMAMKVPINCRHRTKQVRSVQ